MKTQQMEHFANLTQEELVTVNGGSGLSSLNPTITDLLADICVTAVATLAAVNLTVTSLTSNLDYALGTNGSGGGLLSGGLLGGSGNGLLGGGINL
jgi:hypothetical protein